MPGPVTTRARAISLSGTAFLRMRRRYHPRRGDAPGRRATLLHAILGASEYRPARFRVGAGWRGAIEVVDDPVADVFLVERVSQTGGESPRAEHVSQIEVGKRVRRHKSRKLVRLVVVVALLPDEAQRAVDLRG